MRAALKLLGAAKPGPNGRRIAVIGDMLELGPDGAAMHAELAADLEANRIDLLFGAGPLTRALYDAAPSSMRAAWAERSEELTATIAAALRGGDVVMVKGSNASRMGPLVAALREHFDRAAEGRERPMLTWLADLPSFPAPSISSAISPSAPSARREPACSSSSSSVRRSSPRCG